MERGWVLQRLKPKKWVITLLFNIAFVLGLTASVLSLVAGDILWVPGVLASVGGAMAVKQASKRKRGDRRSAIFCQLIPALVSVSASTSLACYVLFVIGPLTRIGALELATFCLAVAGVLFTVLGISLVLQARRAESCVIYGSRADGALIVVDECDEGGDEVHDSIDDEAREEDALRVVMPLLPSSQISFSRSQSSESFVSFGSHFPELQRSTAGEPPPLLLLHGGFHSNNATPASIITFLDHCHPQPHA